MEILNGGWIVANDLFSQGSLFIFIFYPGEMQTVTRHFKFFTTNFFDIRMKCMFFVFFSMADACYCEMPN